MTLRLGKTFITGVAASYDSTYDEARLKGNIDRSEYSYIIGLLNNTVHSYWPCAISIWLGYILAPFTLGLSFLIPNLCISDAKAELLKVIDRQNRVKLSDKGLKLRYVQGCSTSWLELSIIKSGVVDEEAIELVTAKEVHKVAPTDGKDRVIRQTGAKYSSLEEDTEVVAAT